MKKIILDTSVVTTALRSASDAVETAAIFLRQRARNAKPSDLLRFLDNAANEPPPEGDEIK